MFLRKEVMDEKEILPFIRDSLISNGWLLLDSIKYTFTSGGVDFEEDAIVIESPSGFIGYIKESYYRYNTINDNRFGLRFNYMDFYNNELPLNQQTGSNVDLNSGFNHLSGSSSYSLYRSLVSVKGRSVFELIINDYRLILINKYDSNNLNIYFGHYLRYGIDKDIYNPSLISGSISSSGSDNESGRTLRVLKYFKRENGDDINRNDNVSFNIENSYTLDGNIILRQANMSNIFLGELSEVYMRSAGDFINGDILEIGDDKYLFNNDLFIKTNGGLQ